MAGFDVLVCPWDSDAGILALAKVANDNNLFEFLQTTWHCVYGNNYASFFRRAGDAAWNGGPPADGKFADSALTLVSELSHVAGDMKASYSASGTSECQIF